MVDYYKNVSPLHTKIHCAKFGWNCQWFWRRQFLNFVEVLLLFHYNLFFENWSGPSRTNLNPLRPRMLFPRLVAISPVILEQRAFGSGELKSTSHHEKSTLHHDKSTPHHGNSTSHNDKGTAHHDKSTANHDKINHTMTKPRHIIWQTTSHNDKDSTYSHLLPRVWSCHYLF